MFAGVSNAVRVETDDGAEFTGMDETCVPEIPVHHSAWIVPTDAQETLCAVTLTSTRSVAECPALSCALIFND